MCKKHTPRDAIAGYSPCWHRSLRRKRSICRSRVRCAKSLGQAPRWKDLRVLLGHHSAPPQIQFMGKGWKRQQPSGQQPPWRGGGGQQQWSIWPGAWHSPRSRAWQHDHTTEETRQFPAYDAAWKRAPGISVLPEKTAKQPGNTLVSSMQHVVNQARRIETKLTKMRSELLQRDRSWEKYIADAKAAIAQEKAKHQATKAKIAKEIEELEAQQAAVYEQVTQVALESRGVGDGGPLEKPAAARTTAAEAMDVDLDLDSGSEGGASRHRSGRRAPAHRRACSADERGGTPPGYAAPKANWSFVFDTATARSYPDKRLHERRVSYPAELCAFWLRTYPYSKAGCSDCSPRKPCQSRATPRTWRRRHCGRQSFDLSVVRKASNQAAGGTHGSCSLWAGPQGNSGWYHTRPWRRMHGASSGGPLCGRRWRRALSGNYAACFSRVGQARVAAAPLTALPTESPSRAGAILPASRLEGALSSEVCLGKLPGSFFPLGQCNLADTLQRLDGGFWTNCGKLCSQVSPQCRQALFSAVYSFDTVQYSCFAPSGSGLIMSHSLYFLRPPRCDLSSSSLRHPPRGLDFSCFAGQSGFLCLPYASSLSSPSSEPFVNAHYFGGLSFRCLREESVVLGPPPKRFSPAHVFLRGGRARFEPVHPGQTRWMSCVGLSLFLLASFGGIGFAYVIDPKPSWLSTVQANMTSLEVLCAFVHTCPCPLQVHVPAIAVVGILLQSDIQPAHHCVGTARLSLPTQLLAASFIGA